MTMALSPRGSSSIAVIESSGVTLVRGLMGVLTEEQNAIRLIKEELQTTVDKVANLEHNIQHLRARSGHDEIIVGDASEEGKHTSDASVEDDVAATSQHKSLAQNEIIRGLQDEIEAMHTIIREFQAKMGKCVYIDDVKEMISSEVDKVLHEKKNGYSNLDAALNSIKEDNDINEESLRDVVHSLMLDLRNCPTISHVKSHVLFHLQKHAMSTETIDNGQEEKNIIEITPYDYIPLERSLVMDTIDRLSDEVSNCGTKKMLILTLLSEVRSVTNKHHGDKTRDDVHRKEEKQKLIDAIREATETFEKRIYHLETQETIMKEQLEKIRHDHDTKASRDIATIQDIKDLLEESNTKVETLISKSISREELEYSKEMIKITDGRIDFLTEMMNNLELDCLKKQTAHTLLEESEVSFSNRFLPKLREIVAQSFEANREFLDRKSSQALNESMGEIKKNIDFRLEAVNDNIEKTIEDYIKHKLDDLEQSSIFLKGCVSKLDAITEKQQRQIDEQWAQHAKDVKSIPSKEMGKETSRNELKILDQNIQKLFDGQVLLRDKLSADVNNLGALIAKAPTSSDIEKAVNNRIQAWEVGLDKTFGEINSHIEMIAKSLNAKAEKEEVMNTIGDNIVNLKKTLSSSIEKSVSKFDDPALSSGCISCGRGKQTQREGSPPRNRYTNPLAASSMTDGGDSSVDAGSSIISHVSGYDRLNMGVDEDSFSREDYQQLLSVIKGEAGLRNLSKQYTPMKPKPNCYLRRSQNELEPLYRRAKYAAQLRENVKVSTPTQHQQLSVNRATSSSVMYSFQDRPKTTGSLNLTKNGDQDVSLRKGKGGISTFKPYGNNGGLTGLNEPDLGNGNDSPVRLLSAPNSANGVLQQPLTNQQVAMAQAIRSSVNEELSIRSSIAGDASIGTYGDGLVSSSSSSRKNQHQQQQQIPPKTSPMTPTRYS